MLVPPTFGILIKLLINIWKFLNDLVVSVSLFDIKSSSKSYIDFEKFKNSDSKLSKTSFSKTENISLISEYWSCLPLIEKFSCLVSPVMLKTCFKYLIGVGLTTLLISKYP